MRPIQAVLVGMLLVSGCGLPITTTPAVGDVNEDGLPDLISNGYEHFDDSWGLDVALAPDFSDPLTLPHHGGGALAVGDVDGDGHLDIVGLDGVSLGDGRGGFGSIVPSQKAGSPASQSTVADVNGDGYGDRISTETHWVRIALGDPTGQLDPIYSYRGQQGLAVVDIDGDGYLDIVASGSEELALLFGDGAGDFSRRIQMLVAGGGLNSVEAADFNGDDVIDLAGLLYDPPGVAVVLGRP